MNRVIRLYIGFQVFFNLLLWVPVFYEVQKRLGLSDPQIFGIQSIYYTAFCLLEIPTGLIADRLGYRFSMLLGAVVLVGANLLPMAVANYQGFLWHFLAIALARSLISGAASAYLYEYLRQQGHSDLYKAAEGDARFYSLVARVVAWAIVGWLMTWQLMSPYWISAVNAGLALFIAAWMPSVDSGRSDAKAAIPGLPKIAQILRSPLILLLMFQGVGIFVMVRILGVNLYQPVLTDKGFDVTTFGWLMSVMTVFEAVGAKLSPSLRRHMTDMAAVTAMTLVLSISLAVIAYFSKVGSLTGFCLFSLASGLAFPVQKQLLNDAITDSRMRATVLSMESILDRAFCAVAVLPLGGLVKAGQLSETLYVTGAATAAGAIVVHLCRTRFKARVCSPSPYLDPAD